MPVSLSSEPPPECRGCSCLRCASPVSSLESLWCSCLMCVSQVSSLGTSSSCLLLLDLSCAPPVSSDDTDQHFAQRVLYENCSIQFRVVPPTSAFRCRLQAGSPCMKFGLTALWPMSARTWLPFFQTYPLAVLSSSFVRRGSSGSMAVQNACTSFTQSSCCSGGSPCSSQMPCRVRQEFCASRSAVLNVRSHSLSRPRSHAGSFTLFTTILSSASLQLGASPPSVAMHCSHYKVRRFFRLPRRPPKKHSRLCFRGRANCSLA